LFGILSNITCQKAINKEIEKYKKNLVQNNQDTNMLVVDDMNVSKGTLNDMLKKNYKLSDGENGKDAVAIIK
jgi:PleD family two-component response regulator